MGIEIEEPELVIGELMKLALEGEVTITRRQLQDLLNVVKQLEREKQTLMKLLEDLTEDAPTIKSGDMATMDYLAEIIRQNGQHAATTSTPQWTVTNNTNHNINAADYAADYADPYTAMRNKAMRNKFGGRDTF